MNSSNNSKRRWLKIAGGIFGTIFLGAIGSGLWEHMRDPVNLLFSSAALMVDRVTGTYLDTLHSSIGNARQNEILLEVGVAFAVVMVFLNILGVFYLLRLRKRLKESDDDSADSKEASPRAGKKILEITGNLMTGKPFFMLLLPAVFNVLAYSNGLFADGYRLGAITWIERSIEIVHPHISDSEFLLLRAQYRAIHNAKSFYELQASIIHYAVQFQVNLPQFKALGNELKVPHFETDEGQSKNTEKK